MLAIVSTGVLLAMSPWLTGAAVAPTIRSEWGLSALEVPLLTVAVQFGFALGAISLAATGAPDVLPARWLFLVGAALAAASNLGFALLATDLPAALPFRFATGAALAAVYPVGMKVIVGWFRAERGLAVGILIAAPPGTAGSALSLQVALGFALTGVTNLGIGALTAEDAAAWRLAFALLALGPLVGIVAMWRLRRRPESVRMAGGRR